MSLICRFIKHNKNWVIIAMLIYFGGMAAVILSFPAGPAQAVSLDHLISNQFEGLESLLKIIENLSPLMMVLVIFINNLISMTQMLLLGFLAGLSPLFTLFVNGALLGAVTDAIVQGGQPLWLFLCLGILPHGIFELSAFFVCGALGLKMGYHCVAAPLPGLSRIQSFFQIWKETTPLILPIITLLGIGAVIEVCVSTLLISKYLI